MEHTITTRTLLGFDEAVDMAAYQIHSNHRGIILNTLFGTIAVEADTDYNWMMPAFAETWKDAPHTDWVIDLKLSNAPIDTYASIGWKPNQDINLTKIELIKALSACLVCWYTGEIPDDEVSSALLFSYLEFQSELPKYPYHISKLVMKRDVGWMIKVNKNTKNMFQLSLEQNIKDLMRNSEQIMHEYASEYDKLLRNGFCFMAGYSIDHIQFYINVIRVIPKMKNYKVNKFNNEAVDQLLESSTSDINIITAIKEVMFSANPVNNSDDEQDDEDPDD